MQGGQKGFLGMKRILDCLDQLSIIVGKASSYLVVVAVLVCAYEVLARYLFTRPTTWGNEAMVFACGYFYVLGAAWCMQAGRHVRIDMLYTHLSPRVQRLMDCLTFPAFVLYMGAMLWVGGKFASESLRLLETSGTPWDPPVYPMKIAFVVGTALLLLQGTGKFVRDLHFAIMGKEL